MIGCETPAGSGLAGAPAAKECSEVRLGDPDGVRRDPNVRQQVPESVVEILRPEEAPPFFEQPDPDQRVVFAAAISSGLRRGDDQVRPCPRCGFKLWPRGN